MWIRATLPCRHLIPVSRLPFSVFACNIRGRSTTTCGPPPRLISSTANTDTKSKRLILVWHSRTGLARQMADAMEEGAWEVARELNVDNDFALDRVPAAEATVEHLRAADGYLFCAPENLGSLSGRMKEFFDRCYYGVFEVSSTEKEYTETSKLLGRPVGIAIAAGSDGQGAARQVERICQGWRLRLAAETFIHRNGLAQTKQNILAPKVCSPEAQEKCKELGGLLAATLLML